MRKVITMDLEDKQCKTVYRYKETVDDSKPPVLNYLYVKKYAFEGKPANKITVTITDEE